MNRAILMGRLTRDAEIRYSQGAEPVTIARYTLAVNRRFAQEGQQSADFIGCVSFGKNAEFMEKYGKQGIKFVIEGRIQTGSYTNKNGVKVYTTEVVTESIEFAESKNAQGGSSTKKEPVRENTGETVQRTGSGRQERLETDNNGFMLIPDGIDEDLPFS